MSSRTTAMLFLLAALAASAGVGCGGGKSTESSSPAKPSNRAAAIAQIRRDWVEFFGGSTPATVKIRLLQNGQRLAPIIRREAASPLAKQTTVTVKSVTLTGRNTARVVYTIMLAGKPALGQVGAAVRIGGIWKVGLSSFCMLLALQGALPPACRRS
jgi:hypothetical protein